MIKDMTGHAFNREGKFADRIMYSLESAGKLKDKRVLIQYYSPADNFVELVATRCRRAGAEPVLNRLNEGAEYKILRSGSDEEMDDYYRQERMNPARKSDMVVVVDSRENPTRFRRLPQERAEMVDEREDGFYELFGRKRRNGNRRVALITEFPTSGYAMASGMGLVDYENMFYDACLIDYKRLSARQDEILKALKNSERILIEGPNANLRIGVEGYSKSCGTFGGDDFANLPDGETGIEPKKVSGKFRASYPLFGNNGTVNGASFVFDEGLVASYSSEDMQRYFRSLVVNKDGTSKAAEAIALGMNPMVTRAVASDLLNTKIQRSLTVNVGNNMGDSVVLTTDMTGGTIYELTPSRVRGNEWNRREIIKIDDISRY